MGYFRRAVRRGVARAEKRARDDAAREADFGPWRAATRAALALPREEFLRFVIERGGGGGGGGATVGLFRSDAYDAELDALPSAARSDLRATFRWFNRHLPVPRRLPRSAVCWFRADAAESLGRIRDLVELYRAAGVRVLMQATAAPGRIVYRDEFQVAAVPYADRRRTVSVM